MDQTQIQFIYWFAYYNLDSPSVRYRARYPLEFARKQFGIRSYLVIPGYSIKRIIFFAKTFASALLFRKRNSLIVIQRVQSNFIYAFLLKVLVKFHKKNTVYDLDDADYLEGNVSTIHYFAQNCEFISAGSGEIVRYLSDINPRTYHVTSPVPDLQIIKKHKNSVLTIGWIGGFGGEHKTGLYNYLFPAIRELTFPLKLILIGAKSKSDVESIERYFESCDELQVEIPLNLDWNNEKDLQMRITEFDVGIATLLDHPVQLAKSGIKAKQYMNNGVPVLSSNLPENNKVVKDGFNGYLCDTAEDFRFCLEQFHHMSDEEYQKFSANARQSVTQYDHLSFLKNLRVLKGHESSIDHNLLRK